LVENSDTYFNHPPFSLKIPGYSFLPAKGGNTKYNAIMYDPTRTGKEIQAI